MKQLFYLLLLVTFFFGTFAQKTLKPGQTFKDCKDCPEMVVIPAGSFTMGSPENESGRYSFSKEEPWEGPQRIVNIQQFAAGKFDITRGQWAAFVADTKRPERGGCSWSNLLNDTLKKWDLNPLASWNHLGFVQDDSHPVVCVSWEDAQDYIRWLNQKTGAHYRLLTESEWEYAARAGTNTPYPWGTKASHEYANYGTDTMPGIGLAMGRDKWDYSTSPVGSFPPNQFGLYDMQGNVLQWVEDCFSISYAGLPTDGSAYHESKKLIVTNAAFSALNGNQSCSCRMVRGGCFADPPCMIRCAFRNFGPFDKGTLHDFGTAGLGFRIAKSLN